MKHAGRYVGEALNVPGAPVPEPSAWALLSLVWPPFGRRLRSDVVQISQRLTPLNRLTKLRPRVIRVRNVPLWGLLHC